MRQVPPPRCDSRSSLDANSEEDHLSSVDRRRPQVRVESRAALDWDNLRFFLSVARTGRISAAAAQLRVDNATVARRISALEKSLSTRLFERNPHGCVPTAAGERLLHISEEVESKIFQAQGALS